MHMKRVFLAKDIENILPQDQHLIDADTLVIDLKKPFVICVTTILEDAPEVDTYFVDLCKLLVYPEESPNAVFGIACLTALLDEDNQVVINHQDAERTEGWGEDDDGEGIPGLYLNKPSNVEGSITIYYE